MIVLSIALTVVITIIMLKVNLGKETDKVIRKLKGNKKQTSD